MASDGMTASGGEGEDDSSGDEGGGGLGQQRALVTATEWLWEEK